MNLPEEAQPARQSGAKRQAPRWLLAWAGVSAILAATPAWADVKTGVDDWSRGDYASAVREWQQGVSQGDPDAEFNMGQAYMLGHGVPRDLARAEALFAKASAQGHLRASDNYGLLLFQRGEHARAMPYIEAAADRGDPRAEYLLGLALFNGDSVPKDWVRGYALVNLAQQDGLPQAQSALAKMDEYIPLEQRRRGIAMSSDMGAQAEANRARQVAAEDLGVAAAPRPHVPPPPGLGTAPAPDTDAVSAPPPAEAMPAKALAEPMARPATRVHPGFDLAPPSATADTTARLAREKPIPPPHAALADSGGWHIQFGAFGVPANADALWNRLKRRPEVSGHARINVRAGAVTKLQAGGYSRDSAEAACAKLRAAGLTCVLAKS